MGMWPVPSPYPAGAKDFATAVNADKHGVWTALNDLESWQETAIRNVFGDGIVPDYLEEMKIGGSGTAVVSVATGLSLVLGVPVEFAEAQEQGIEAGDGTQHVYLHNDGTLSVLLSGTVPDGAIEIGTVTVTGGVIAAIQQDMPYWWFRADAFLQCVGPFRNGFSRNGTSAYNGGGHYV